jgi:hypothetical protein
VFTLAKVLGDSGYFADARGAAQVVVRVLAGRELGVGPVASMTGVYVLQGRVTLSANLIAALIRRSVRYDYRLVRLDQEACNIEIIQDGQVVGTSCFTMDDARKAGLDGGVNWRKYPRNMLFARAVSNAARWFCPDVFAGCPVFTPDELGAEVDEEGALVAEVIESRPPSILTPDQHGRLLELIARTGSDTVRLLKHYGVDALTELSPAQCDDAVAILHSKLRDSSPRAAEPAEEDPSMASIS